MKYWDGTDWIEVPTVHYTADGWATANVFGWDGTQWVGKTSPPTGTVTMSTADAGGWNSFVAISDPAVHKGNLIAMAGGDVSGLWRSIDLGNNWRPSNNAAQNSQYSKTQSIHWSTHTAGKVYALTCATGDGGKAWFYRSDDYGWTWNAIWNNSTAGLDTGGGNHPRWYGTNIYEASDGQVFFGGYNGLYKSTNASTSATATFSKVAGTTTMWIQSLAGDTLNDNILYFGVRNGAANEVGVYSFQRDTLNMYRATDSAPIGDIHQMRTITLNGVCCLFVGAGLGGVYRFRRPGTGGATAIQTGSNWTNLTNNLPHTTTIVRTTESLTSASGSHTVNVTGDTSGFVTSGDNKVSFGRQTGAVTAKTSGSLTINTTSSSETMTWGAGISIASCDSGTTSPGRWVAIDVKSYDSNQSAVVMVGHNDNGYVSDGNLVSGGVRNMIWRATGVTATSSAPTWTTDVASGAVSDDFPGVTPAVGFYHWTGDPTAYRINGTAWDTSAISMHPTNQNIALASGRGGMAKRASGTNPKWRPGTRGLGTMTINGLAVHPTDPTKMIMTCTDWTGMTSDHAFLQDSTANWAPKEVSGGPSGAGAGCWIQSDGYGFMGSDAGVWYSANPWAATPSWTKFSGTSGTVLGGVSYTNGGTRYTICYVDGTGFFRSTDLGALSNQQSVSGTNGQTSVNIVRDPNTGSRPNYVYAMIPCAGLFRSTDNGANWTNIFPVTSSGTGTSQGSGKFAINPLGNGDAIVSVSSDVWYIQDVNNGTLNANGTNATGTISARAFQTVTGNDPGPVGYKPNGLTAYIWQSGEAGPRSGLYKSTDFSSITRITSTTQGPNAYSVLDRFGFDLECMVISSKPRIYLGGRGEGILVVDGAP